MKIGRTPSKHYRVNPLTLQKSVFCISPPVLTSNVLNPIKNWSQTHRQDPKLAGSEDFHVYEEVRSVVIKNKIYFKREKGVGGGERYIDNKTVKGGTEKQ